MERLLEYLNKQRDERVKKLEAYGAALAELDAVQKKVDAFGDMGGIEGEIDELDGFIESVGSRIAMAKEHIVPTMGLNDPEGTEGVEETATTVGDQDVEGVADEIVVTCEEA